MDETPKNTTPEASTQKKPAQKKPARLSWRRLLQVCFLLLFVSVTAPFVVPAIKLAKAFLGWQQTVRDTLTLLQSENLLFLVTDKLTSQIMVEVAENNPILGKREGVLVGTVTLYYGVDLRKLEANSISREGSRLIVTLPDPQELDFSVDPTSLKCITKKSGLNVIADFVMNKDMEAELREQLKANAIKFFSAHDLMPTKHKIVKQLNEFAPVLSEKIGVAIEFR